MKLFKVLIVSCTAAAMLVTSACSSDKPSGDPELFKAEESLRPPKVIKSIRTADMLYKIETDRESDIMVRIRFRAPNRLRMDLSMEKLHAVCCVDTENSGKKPGWVFDRYDGLKDLSSDDVEQILKETVKLPFFRYSLPWTFKNSDKIGAGLLNYEECWLFTCHSGPFKTKEQLLIWVGQNTKEVRLVEIGAENVIQFFNYKDIGGIKLPTLIYESGKDGISKTTLLRAVWNQRIPLSVFYAPVTEKTIKLQDGRTFADPVLISKTDDSVSFAHKEGLMTLPLKDIPPELVKKIAAQDADAQKRLKKLEAREAIEDKKTAEKAAAEAKKAKKNPAVEKPALSEGEKTLNAMRENLSKFQIDQLEARLADQKKSGSRFAKPAQYGFFSAGPHYFRERYIRFHSVSKAVKKPAPAAEKKAPAADKKQEKKAPAADKKQEKKAPAPAKKQEKK